MPLCFEAFYMNYTQNKVVKLVSNWLMLPCCFPSFVSKSIFFYGIICISKQPLARGGLVLFWLQNLYHLKSLSFFFFYRRHIYYLTKLISYEFSHLIPCDFWKYLWFEADYVEIHYQNALTEVMVTKCIS